MIGFLVGAPVVHAVHHNAFWLGSLGMRAGSLALMIGGAAMMFSACPLFADRCDAGERDVGMAVAIAGLARGVPAPVVDAVLAVEVVPRDQLTMRPLLAPSAGGLGLGLAVAGRL